MILPIGYWVAQLIGWKVNEKAENISTKKLWFRNLLGPPCWSVPSSLKHFSIYNRIHHFALMNYFFKLDDANTAQGVSFSGLGPA